MDLKQTGRTIAKLRKQRGFTQAELAEKLGISDKAVSKWERGIACPDISFFGQLSALLDSDIESLVYGTEMHSHWKGILITEGFISSDTLVYDKPLLHYQLSVFLLAGITDITVVGSCHKPEYPGLILHTVDSMKSFVPEEDSNYLVIHGDTFIYGANLTRVLKRAMSSGRKCSQLVSLRRKGRYPVTFNDDRKICSAEKTDKPGYYAEPLIFIRKGAEKLLKKSIPELIRSHEVTAETVVRGMMIFHLENYDDVMNLSQFVRIAESTSGEKIGCIEEILIRRGIVSYSDLPVKELPEETRSYLEVLFG